jgi:hypothetical protein
MGNSTHKQSLTEGSIVDQMRADYINGQTITSIAKQHGISRTHTWAIVTYKHWKNIQ